MKKIISSLLIFAALSAGVALFSADAEITYVKGKVEVQRGNEWVSLKPGDKVAKNEMISTGFQSEAKVKLLDSIMSLGPVTRISVEELSAGKTQDKVNVYLKTGSVRSQVNHADSKRVTYQVHTAVAVASARGTDYSMFSTGETFVASGVVGVAAYVPPAGDSVDEATVDEVETEDQTESSASADSAAETVSSDATDTASSESATSEPAAPEQKVVLVKANQSAKVSATGSVSAPVSKAVQAVNAVVQSVSTAASKESVSSSASAVSALSSVTAAPATMETPKVESPKPTTGLIEITVSIE